MIRITDHRLKELITHHDDNGMDGSIPFQVMRVHAETADALRELAAYRLHELNAKMSQSA